MYDYFWTRGDRVIGVYYESSTASFIQFILSSTGIIVLVIVPSCIVLLILAYSIIDIIDKMLKKKKEDEARNNAIIKEGNAENEDMDKKIKQFMFNFFYNIILLNFIFLIFTFGFQYVIINLWN